MKILISTPAYKNNIHARMAHSLVRATVALRKANIAFNWDIPSSSILSYNRNKSAHHAIQDENDWLLFWDADIAVKDSDFIKEMIDEAHRHDAAVAGLPVCLKGTPKTYNFANKFTNGYENSDKMPTLTNEVDAIGCGVMLINVPFLKKLSPPWFSFTDTFHEQPGFFPEDWGFCEKVKEAGGKVIVVPFSTIHYGECEFK